MNKLKQTAYANPETEVGKTVAKALQAYLDGPVPATLKLALQNLEAHYEQKSDLPDVEIAERYVVECWEEYAHPQGAVYKTAH